MRLTRQHGTSAFVALLLGVAGAAAAETSPQGGLDGKHPFALEAADGFQQEGTVFLFDPRPVRINVAAEDMFHAAEIEVDGRTYVCTDLELSWGLQAERDATGERMLRRYDAWREPELKTVGLETARILDPGAAGGRCIVDVTLAAVYQPGSRWRRWLGSPVEATTTARLVVVAPMAVPREHVFEAMADLGLGRYLDPYSRKDLDYATELRGGIPTRYPAEQPEHYRPPRLLYRCTAETRDVPVSTHLRLADFAMDYPWFSLGLPQYVAVVPELVAKLEDLIALLQEAGLAQRGLSFIYGFRAPVFNLDRIEDEGSDRTLKDPFSTHQYGMAADVIVDDDGDRQLDDLNHDGTVDIHDAAVILYYVNLLDRNYRDAKDPRVGGAGIYYHHDFWERPVQSPYCHLDVRGFLRPDNTLIRWASPKSTWPDGEPIRFARIDERGFPVP